MKLFKKFLYYTVIFSSFSLNLSAYVFPGFLAQTSRDCRYFKSRKLIKSSKRKIKANKIFLLRKVLNHGALIENHKGNKAWVKKDCLNFIIPTVETKKESAQNNPPKDINTHKPVKNVNPLDMRNNFSVIFEYNIKSKINFSGISYWWYIPLGVPTVAKSTFKRFGVQFQLLGDFENYWDNFKVPIYLKWLFRDVNSWFSYGLSVGGVYQKYFNSNKIFSSLNFSFGYMPLQPGFTSFVNIGTDFFKDEEYRVQWNIGWLF